MVFSYGQSPVRQGEGARQFNKNPSLGQEYVPPVCNPRNFYISLFHALFMGRCKSMCLTDKLVRDFETLVSNCREGKVLSDINNKKGDL